MLYQGDNAALRKLSIAMAVIGISFFGLPVVVELLPDLFRWSHPVNLADERMIVSMFIAQGICLVMGAKDPVRNSIIIDYTIISCVLHAAVMFYYAFNMEGEMPHMWGDVPLLFVLAIGFAIFHPRRLARAGV